MNTTTKAVRYFSKCRVCKSPAVRDFATVGGNRIPFVLSFQGWESIYNATSMGYIHCDCGGKLKQWAPLKATFSAKHECNAKCLASTSGKCECSCGGKNHGSGHAHA